MVISERLFAISQECIKKLQHEFNLQVNPAIDYYHVHLLCRIELGVGENALCRDVNTHESTIAFHTLRAYIVAALYK